MVIPGKPHPRRGKPLHPGLIPGLALIGSNSQRI